ncbi:MAG: hypothetical protein ACI92S_001949 [Planctomycetaceae bacterium]|jgi:hypothetical protein
MFLELVVFVEFEQSDQVSGKTTLLRRTCRLNIIFMNQRSWVALILLYGMFAFVASRCLAADDDSAETADTAAQSEDRLVVIIRGASGTSEYGQLFDSWSDRWEAAAVAGGAKVTRIGPKTGADDSVAASDQPSDADRSSIEQVLGDAAAQAKSKKLAELWVVLIGHGTFDGRSARFNLRGNDFGAEDLKKWLEPVTCPIAIANCSSASGPFLKALAGQNRVVMTATKTGAEINFARFGEFLSEAVGDSKFDLDKDGQTSAFEAFLSASRRTLTFYESEGRLATEHSLLDDNGDGLGVRADFFRGVRLVKKVQGEATVDGRLAHRFHLVRSDSEQQLSPKTRKLRDQLEQTVIQLRDRKPSFDDEDAYYGQLEELLVELAKAYESSSAAPAFR